MKLDYVDGEVHASWKNYESVVRYLEERGDRWTKHTSAAWLTRGATLDRLLYPERGVEDRLLAAETVDSLLDAMIAIVRVHYMPHSEVSKKVARRFLDTSVFSLPTERGPAPEYLVRLALQADDLALAQGFWSQMSADDRESIPKPAELPWREGRITGNLTLTACGTDGVRIGLYRAPEEPADEATIPGVAHLLAATEAEADGSFAFTGLMAGNYHLALLLPRRFGSDPTGVDIAGTMETHRVSPETIVARAPKIEVNSRGCVGAEH
jgi:hypothetical protein